MSIFKCSHPRLVVITRPDLYEEEVDQITELLEADADFLLHLRKPDADAEVYRSLLNRLPKAQLQRITLGDHFELVDEFPVGGVHLSGRQKEYHGSRSVRISKSCHTFEELSDISAYDYVFFSPIFNSISKQGYDAAFTQEELIGASEKGLINEKVVALGGVDAETMLQLSPFNFGGAAVLGTVWKPFSVDCFKRLVIQFRK